jgi:hypothetical protein
MPVANVCSIGHTAASEPKVASEAVAMTVQREAGQMTHQLIALSVETPGSDISSLARGLWQQKPVGGPIASQTRTACVTRASAYLRRMRPDGWALVGAEVRVGHAKADLVWVHDASGDIVIDEIKSGAPGIGDTGVAGQVRRLYAGGLNEWGDRFVGVRLVQLRAPALTAIWVVADGGQLVKSADDRLAVR